MFTFTIENSEFLNEFYIQLKEYVKKSYAYTAKFLIHPTLMEDYKEQEMLTLILINKSRNAESAFKGGLSVRGTIVAAQDN